MTLPTVTVAEAVTAAPARRCDLLAVLLGTDAEGTITVPAQVQDMLGVDLAAFAVHEQASTSAGEVCTLTLPTLLSGQAPWHDAPNRVLLVGTGAGDAAALRRAGAAISRAGAGRGHVAIDLGDYAAGVGPLTEGLLLASYRQPFSGTGSGPTPAPESFTLVGATTDTGADTATIDDARIAARATCRARTLAATPSNIKNPQWFADQAATLVAQAGGRRAGLRLTVRDERWIAEQGLGGLDAVGRGSATPPRLAVLEYRPKGVTGAPVLLVGKGITYDTGGLSLKPREAMVPMKTDMSGAAVVLAATLAAAEMGVPVPVVAVMPLAENAMGGASYRPGDVVRIFDGTTVQIGNTDAEGRMVLADGITWGRATYAPSVVVDVATLTGAASLGLGKIHAALYATSNDLTQAFVDAGQAVGEPLWPMPLVREYRKALDSPVADLSHISNDPTVGGGSITAALFLQEFVGDTPWVHLDIAGPGRSEADRFEICKGATGVTARTLLRWLELSATPA